ncbi:MAG: hypothetical protein AAB871_00140 [Patescibacteria group bacterium]
MKQKMKLILRFATILILIVALLLPSVSMAPSPAQAQLAFVFLAQRLARGPFPPFGGEIKLEEWKICLRRLPYFPWILPIPFRYLEVDRPSPATMYYLFGISTLYREYEIDETTNSLGNFVLGGDDLWRDFCDINGNTFPEADGVTWKIGTSCRTEPKEGLTALQLYSDACHRRVALIEKKQLAEYGIVYAALRAYLGSLKFTARQSFNPEDPAYAPYCDTNSPEGECYPIGTCDSSASESAGSCVLTSEAIQECLDAGRTDCGP